MADPPKEEGDERLIEQVPEIRRFDDFIRGWVELDHTHRHLRFFWRSAVRGRLRINNPRFDFPQVCSEFMDMSPNLRMQTSGHIFGGVVQLYNIRWNSAVTMAEEILQELQLSSSHHDEASTSATTHNLQEIYSGPMELDRIIIDVESYGDDSHQVDPQTITLETLLLEDDDTNDPPDILEGFDDDFLNTEMVDPGVDPGRPSILAAGPTEEHSSGPSAPIQDAGYLVIDPPLTSQNLNDPTIGSLPQDFEMHGVSSGDDDAEGINDNQNQNPGVELEDAVQEHPVNVEEMGLNNVNQYPVPPLVYDEVIVLSNQQMRRNLEDTSSLRRVRRTEIPRPPESYGWFDFSCLRDKKKKPKDYNIFTPYCRFYSSDMAPELRQLFGGLPFARRPSILAAGPTEEPSSGPSGALVAVDVLQRKSSLSDSREEADAIPTEEPSSGPSGAPVAADVLQRKSSLPDSTEEAAAIPTEEPSSGPSDAPVAADVLQRKSSLPDSSAEAAAIPTEKPSSGPSGAPVAADMLQGKQALPDSRAEAAAIPTEEPSSGLSGAPAPIRDAEYLVIDEPVTSQLLSDPTMMDIGTPPTGSPGQGFEMYLASFFESGDFDAEVGFSMYLEPGEPIAQEGSFEPVEAITTEDYSSRANLLPGPSGSRLEESRNDEISESSSLSEKKPLRLGPIQGLLPGEELTFKELWKINRPYAVKGKERNHCARLFNYICLLATKDKVGVRQEKEPVNSVQEIFISKKGYWHEPGVTRELGVFTWGSSIRSMWQDVKDIFEKPSERIFVVSREKPTVHIIFAGSTADAEFIPTLKEQLQIISDKFPGNFKVDLVLNTSREVWDNGVGPKLREIIQDRFPKPSASVKILTCCPPPVDAQIADHLRRCGYTDDMMFHIEFK